MTSIVAGLCTRQTLPFPAALGCSSLQGVNCNICQESALCQMVCESFSLVIAYTDFTLDQCVHVCVCSFVRARVSSCVRVRERETTGYIFLHKHGLADTSFFSLAKYSRRFYYPAQCETHGQLLSINKYTFTKCKVHRPALSHQRTTFVYHMGENVTL